MVKIVVPIEKFEDEDSLIFQHFGRAPLFALVTLTKDNKLADIRSIQNLGEHFGGHGTAEALALKLNVDAVIVKGMGPRGIQAFQEKEVAVFTGEVNTIREAVDEYIRGKLSKLTEPCKDARHRLKPT